MKGEIKKRIKVILKIPFPNKIIELLKIFILNYEGLGIGNDSIENEINCCLSLLKSKPKIFLDIGAYKGNYTLSLLKRKFELEYHLFEPSIKNFEKLKKEISIENVFINNIGLSKYKGISKLFSNYSGSGLASLTKRRLDHLKVKMDFEEEIYLDRLDNIWKDKNKVLDYVKIDVEGHELDVLEGFGDLIKNTKLIQFEFGGTNVDTRTFFKDFWYFFNTKDFSIYRITPRGTFLIKNYSEKLECFSIANYIALNNKLNY